MKRKVGISFLFFAFLTVYLTQSAFGQTSFQVTINTSAIKGKAGKLAFDFTSGDSSVNTVSILDFSTDGTRGLPETQGGLVQGDIILGLNPAPFTMIADGFFFNELVVPFNSFGDQITFTLQVTQSRGTDPIPDEFALFLLHTRDKPMIGTTDPFRAHALFTIDVTGVSGGLLTPFSPTTVSGTAINVVVPAIAPLVAAVLPSSRSVQVGTPATAFVTILHAGPAGSLSVLDAGPSLVSSIPASFLFQTTDPNTNVVTGTPSTPVDISQGGGQTFVIALTPSADVAPTDVIFDFSGANGAPVTTIPGVNTLLFSASTPPIPDIVALAATLNNDGIVNIPGATGTGVFAVATVNVGVTGTITASADTGAATLPVNVNLCETNPTTGACISDIGPSVPTTINANATPTFGIFVTGTANVPFDPATNRIFVRFRDAGGVTRGATSVAVRSQ